MPVGEARQWPPRGHRQRTGPAMGAPDAPPWIFVDIGPLRGLHRGLATEARPSAIFPRRREPAQTRKPRTLHHTRPCANPRLRPHMPRRLLFRARERRAGPLKADEQDDAARVKRERKIFNAPQRLVLRPTNATAQYTRDLPGTVRSLACNACSRPGRSASGGAAGTPGPDDSRDFSDIFGPGGMRASHRKDASGPPDCTGVLLRQARRQK
jgi:hypothetical protein